MLFNSLQFILLFLPVALVVFVALPAEPLFPRKAWLIFASLVFYAYWRVEYVALLLASMALNYGCAEFITRCERRTMAKLVCSIAVVLNVALLAYFKYANFLVGIFAQLSRSGPQHFDIILPLAISFFTFTQISYVVDVYRDRDLHYRLTDYILFVVFFPHLIAGPIVRHWEIIPQFAKRKLTIGATDGSIGAALFVIGLCKKVFFADPLSHYVDAAYSSADTGITVSMADAWLATLAFAFQIYFDFSGYSDMAIGLARIFGIKFPMNFNSPYQATSVSDFWSRWHITLSRFLREYVYFPLGGNRCSPLRQATNVMTTMLISGLWHGAGWTFIAWGAVHGIYLTIAQRWRKLVGNGTFIATRWYRSFAIGITFLAVLFAWVLFRASTIGGAMKMLKSMVGANGFTISAATTDPNRFPGNALAKAGATFVPAALSGVSYNDTLRLICFLAVAVFLLPNSIQPLQRFEPTVERIVPARISLRLNWLNGAVAGILLFIVIRSFFTSAPSAFVYFNF